MHSILVMDLMKRIIRFKDWDDAVGFVSKIESLQSDVNIYNGNMIFDAKSILGVTNLDLKKNYTVEFVGQNLEELQAFRDIVEGYEV